MSRIVPLPHLLTTSKLDPSFEDDMRNTRILYDYNGRDENGNPAKWRYECWIFSDTRLVYKIHGGPFAGRLNYQAVSYQCIRPGHLWQINWLEETGTVVSLVYDIPGKQVTALLAFSKGHWEQAEATHGDKRIAEDFQRWKDLAKEGTQTDRFMLSMQAEVVQKHKGGGDLVPILETDPTF
ncbi:hypothetical protein G7Z17_g12860 [Cylindrodendrum hubeiense]|uniref:Phenol acid carboxylase n=1 Tax=Cylindrodendrum hubeiense TaxID=595255 RepID=A0A9P5LA64_9HYPO|nr:hypothetical protein G7Z17_g12860 [Cylindrodendrum hubeiense]